MGTVKWHEAIQGLKRTSVKRDSIELNHNQMVMMHNKCCEIVGSTLPKIASDSDIVVGIETYLAENVEYDYDSIAKGRTLRMSSRDGLAIGTFGGVNGAFNAIMYNSCVCEGYTRAMQYLLKLKGIESRNVRCIAGEDKLHMSANGMQDRHTRYDLPDVGYHSIICIESMGSLYCDPCWNANRWQKGDKSLPWTLLNKREISKTHTLSFQERNVSNEHIVVPRNVITDSLRGNKLFTQARLSNVQNVGQKVLKEAYKGQIIDEKGER